MIDFCPDDMNYKASFQCQVKGLPALYLERFGYKTDGAFVEIGAFNGYNWSNTWMLAEAGWRGLLVEPQPDLYQQCVGRYKDNPRISLEQCCIGADVGETKLYLGGSISTIVPERVDLYGELDWSAHVGMTRDKFIVCPMLTLDALLEKHDWPVGFEVLVIDVEGAEPAVLSAFDLDRWQPMMVIVELNEESPDKRLSANAGEVGLFFASHGYEKIYADHINSIFWKENDAD